MKADHLGILTEKGLNRAIKKLEQKKGHRNGMPVSHCFNAAEI